MADYLSHLSQLPWLLTCTLGVYSLCRRWRARMEGRIRHLFLSYTEACDLLTEYFTRYSSSFIIRVLVLQVEKTRIGYCQIALRNS